MNALRLHRLRPEPRIAGHKLGLYTGADARERRAIVKDQMRPKEFAQLRYFDAREAMVDHLLNGDEDAEEMFMMIEYLASGYHNTSWAAQNAALCIESVGCFLKKRDFSMFQGMILSRGPRNPPPMQLGGVLVDVEPDLILRGENRNGKPVVGAIKLHLTRTQPLDPEQGKNYAALLFAYLKQHGVRPGETVSPRRCYVWDVFREAIIPAPQATTRRIQNMEACCEEIAFRWRSN